MKVPPDTSRYGTVEWLVNAYLKHSSFTERVAEFSRPIIGASSIAFATSASTRAPWATRRFQT
jgi:hypothetical protein